MPTDPPKTESSENFFDRVNFDWEAYLYYRPKYSTDFYNRIYDYHRSNGVPDLHLAHDIGTGPGNVALELGKKFATVVASDASKAYTSIASERLSESSDKAEYKVIHSRGEDLSSALTASADPSLSSLAGKADLLAVAEALPLMDGPAAMASFYQLLRPGGTLAIWFYGKPVFVSRSSSSSSSHFDLARARELHSNAATRVMSRAGEAMRAQTPQFDASTRVICSWFDIVGLDPSRWENVKRIKFNSEHSLYFCDENYVADVGSSAPSQVDGANETVEMIDDDTFWGEEVDAEWIRGFLKANLPNAAPFVDGEVEKTLLDLQQALGGNGKRQWIAYPAILILATKRGA